MDKIIHKIFILAALLFLINVSPVLAEEYTCYLNAPKMDDIWVIVYSSDRDGNRGEIIWKGKISAGETIAVKCDTGHIRYTYAMEQDQPYEGDLDRWCNDGNEIQLP